MSAELSKAQEDVILRHYDRTLGGEEVVSAAYPNTLDALERRGLVCRVSMPRWTGGPHTARLTATGLAERQRLEDRALPRPLDQGGETDERSS